MKKKILIALCVAALCSSLVACGDNEKDTSNSSVESVVSTMSSSENNAKDDNESVETPDTKTEMPVKVENAQDIIDNLVNNVKDNKNCTATAEMSMNATVNIKADGESETQKMNQKMTTDMWSNDKGMHVVTNTVASEDDEPEHTYTEEKYVVFDTNKQYIHSDDYGDYWYEQTYDSDSNNSAILDTSGLFSDSEQFKNATVETVGNNYIISLNLSEVEDFTNTISSQMDGAAITGSLVITVDQDFYPTCIEMKDVNIDTSALENMIKSFATTGVEDSNTEENSSVTPDIDVKMDIEFAFKINFTSWNSTKDSDVTPTDDIISNSIAINEEGISITDDSESSIDSSKSKE